MAKIPENAASDSSYAPQGFNRWLIPLAAVLVQVCIGSVYAWSTFNRPINAMFPPAPANSWLAWFKAPYITFSAALVLLGLSAAIGGSWVERHGPRATARAAAAFFGAGLVIGGIGLQIRQEWLVFLGMGVIGGIGGGLGYIAPVSTLVKWFPDRRGMATGMAIMGFGAGAFLAGYVNAFLIEHVGVAATLFALGVVYFIVMNIGAQIMRRPTPGWKPERWTPMPVANQIAPEASLTQKAAVRSYQFWLLWGMLFINVTAGIGILAQASPMMQDVFGKTVLQASGVVSIISLFNAGGRFFWAALSDYIGRKTTYFALFWAGADWLSAYPSIWRRWRMAFVPDCSLYGFHYVRRRLCDDSGLPSRYIWAQPCRRYPWGRAHRLECGGDSGSCDHHAIIGFRQAGARSWCEQGAHLRSAARSAGRTAGRWLYPHVAG